MANWGDTLKKVAPRLPTEGIKHTHYDGGRQSEHITGLNLRSKKIAIGLPMDEVIFSQFLVNYLGLDMMPWDSMISTTSTYLPEARNKIHNSFLKSATDCDHLFMLDSDVMPPPKTIEMLLSHGKDLVGGWYRKKEKYPLKTENGVQIIQRPVVYDNAGIRDGIIQYTQKIVPGTGLEEVAAAGAGCWLMSRKLAEALGENPYSMENGGEDMNLCRQTTKLGFSMWVDWSIACAHIGTFFV